jgi:DNA-binding TFAR19-related protein (PDSD5 family)
LTSCYFAFIGAQSNCSFGEKWLEVIISFFCEEVCNIYQLDLCLNQMFPMSDNELRALRRRKLRELKKQKRSAANRQNVVKQVEADKVLNKVFKGRAWEIFRAASSQYPDFMDKLKGMLVKLALSGKIEELTGEQLYFFLRNLGLRIRLNTQIRYADQGKLKSLSDKIKDDLWKH